MHIMQNLPPSRQPQSIKPVSAVAGIPSGAGMLASLLLEKEEITQEQLSYAIRVNKKMATPQTLLQTLIELGYTSADKVKQSLCSSSLNIRLGDLLVELGYLKESDLRQARESRKKLTARSVSARS